MQILRSMTCKNTLIWSCPFFSELQFQNYENDTIASFLENGHTCAFRGDNCNSFYRLIFISRSTADFSINFIQANYFKYFKNKTNELDPFVKPVTRQSAFQLQKSYESMMGTAEIHSSKLNS